METQKKGYSCTFSEGRTDIGQLVKFTCSRENVDQVHDLLALVRTIDIPTTHKVNVSHGGYGQYSRYDITQHKYAGGRGGFIEVLEIKNPPDERCGIVAYVYGVFGDSAFYEFRDLSSAIKAFSLLFNCCKKEKLLQIEGLLRVVRCGLLRPWFYAVADQNIMGDLVFPNAVTEDPIFWFGRKFIVTNLDGFKTIKTCMGIIYLPEIVCFGKTKRPKRVFWEDGTYLDEERVSYKPRPLTEEEFWIEEAMNQFRKLLAGQLESFSIDFKDGSQFRGKWVPPVKAKCAEGTYLARIELADGKIKEVSFQFRPTPEVPTAEDFLKQEAKAHNIEIKNIQLLKKTSRSRDRMKWAGVYKPPE